MGRSGTAGRWIALALVAGAALPATASAAVTRPDVTTGQVTNVKETTATLNGRINPNGAETSYEFRIGLSKIYSMTVPVPRATIPAGTSTVLVNVDVSGLSPATTYHYRLVADNAKGTRVGVDKTFTTKKQPLGLSALTASPTSVKYGSGFTLTGVLAGTDNAGRQVQLQADFFPFNASFSPFLNTLVTGSDGSFTFTIPSATVSGQYRVTMPAKPEIVSPLAEVDVKPIVRTKVSRKTVTRGRRVTFSGSTTPLLPEGSGVEVQRLRSSGWSTVARSTTFNLTADRSGFKKRVKIRRTGKYRVRVIPASGSGFISYHGRTVRIRARG